MAPSCLQVPTWPWHLCLVLSKSIDDDDLEEALFRCTVYIVRGHGDARHQSHETLRIA